MPHKKLIKAISLLKEIIALPKVTIRFKEMNDESKKNYQTTYEYFTKPHRLKIIQNKSIGVALIDLGLYQNYEEYYKSVNGKNSAAYYSRKALKRGYEFLEIDRDDFVDDIYEINTSSETRQGQKMSSNYIQKTESYHNEPNYRYFGIVDGDGILRSYCYIGFYGEFALVSTLLGHKRYLNDGIMYLMLIELSKLIFQEFASKGYKYIMYDTFFGALDGLKKFKKKLGYKPYRVKWIWED